MHRKSIKDQVCLITGAASGIGKLVAIRLAKLGATVVLWDVNGEGLATVGTSCKPNFTVKRKRSRNFYLLLQFTPTPSIWPPRTKSSR